MKKFAFMRDTKVHSIEEFEELPPFHPDLEIIDITDLSPFPEEGWDYDGSIFISSATIEKRTLYKINVTNFEASKRILALDSSWTQDNHSQKQRNALMRSLKLARRESLGTATAEEIAELDIMETMVDAIEAIRLASNSIIAEIEALTTIESVDSYGVEINPLWP